MFSFKFFKLILPTFFVCHSQCHPFYTLKELHDLVMKIKILAIVFHYVGNDDRFTKIKNCK